MAKLILLMLAGLVAYLIIKNYRRRVERDEQSVPPAAGETMVRCAHCGVHHPRSESFLAAGKFYCSAEHQRLGRPE